MEKQRADFSCDTDVAEDTIDKSLLGQAVANHDRMLLTVPLPLIVICILMWDHPNFSLAAAICMLQAAAYGFAWAANINLRQALSADSGITRALRWRTASIALTGVMWGLELLPVAGSMTGGIAQMFVMLTILVCVSVSSLMEAPVRAFPIAMTLGFMAGGTPVYLYFANDIGFMPAICQVLYGPGMIWMSGAVHQHVRKAVCNEIHNARLAVHLQSALDTAEYLSQRDSLTALLNRRAFEREAMSFRGKSPAPQPAQIILFDLDHFKSINDNHGHSTGDTVLKTVADTMDRVFSGPLPDSFTHVRTGRWGGEEFIVLLGGASPEGACAIAEILRSAVAAARRQDWPKGLTLTASFGVSDWASTEPLHEAIARADEAMYRAKNSGRDCVKMIHTEARASRESGFKPLIARG